MYVVVKRHSYGGIAGVYGPFSDSEGAEKFARSEREKAVRDSYFYQTEPDNLLVFWVRPIEQGPTQ